MEENEYRQTYRSVNERRCVFEKLINARRASCSRAQRILLAEREGVACHSAAGQQRCQAYLQVLQEKSRFSLQMTDPAQPLPHIKVMKLQGGGVLGLQTCLFPERAGQINSEDIYTILDTGLSYYGDMQKFPFSQIVQAIAHYQPRPKKGTVKT